MIKCFNPIGVSGVRTESYINEAIYLVTKYNWSRRLQNVFGISFVELVPLKLVVLYKGNMVAVVICLNPIKLCMHISLILSLLCNKQQTSCILSVKNKIHVLNLRENKLVLCIASKVQKYVACLVYNV